MTLQVTQITVRSDRKSNQDGEQRVDLVALTADLCAAKVYESSPGTIGPGRSPQSIIVTARTPDLNAVTGNPGLANDGLRRK